MPLPYTKEIYNFKFSLNELLYCSYNHPPINGIVANTPDAYEIVQIINVANTIKPSQQFTVSYVYYKNQDHMVTLGYINPITANSSSMLRTVWTLTEAAGKALSLNLFDGRDNNKDALNASETTFVFDNSSGETYKVILTVSNGQVTINIYSKS